MRFGQLAVVHCQLARLKPTTILEDATVPRSQIAPMVEAINAIAKKYNIPICTFGHAGDGNLHPTCMTDARNEERTELNKLLLKYLRKQLNLVARLLVNMVLVR